MWACPGGKAALHTKARSSKPRVVSAAFALGRAVGGAGEYFDHADFGQPMDMRIPVSECTALSADVDED